MIAPVITDVVPMAGVRPRTFVDQMGHTLELAEAPERIVSLVPSQTELLYDLGLGDRVVGVTRYCLHPTKARRAAKVIGGTKRFDFPAIASLKPDLIIGNKEENYREGIEKLRASFPLWMSDIFCLEDALEMIRAIGELCSVTPRSELLISSISNSWADVAALDGPSALYLIWKKPYMGVGSETFIDDVLRRLGFSNALSGNARYPALDLATMRKMKPDVLLLSSEPFPFTQEHLAELAREIPGTIVKLVDGEMFSWYGSRLLHGPAYFGPLLKSINEKIGWAAAP